MNTFLPYESFAKSASCLDRQRLGKQRVEAMQILNMLVGRSRGNWQRHPAVRMWRGYEWMLLRYGVAICREWLDRGYRDTVLRRLLTEYAEVWAGSTDTPFWLGDKAFHAAHRSNLLRKNAEWYGQFGWMEPTNLPYVWPVPMEITT
jgi:hypothetical protein